MARLLARTAFVWGIVLFACPAVARGAEPPSLPRNRARNPAEVPRGLYVVLGDGSPESALRLATHQGVTLLWQSPNQETVDAVSRAAESAGLLGVSVFVSCGKLDRIALADGLADAVWPFDDAPLNETEAWRVLKPQGLLCRDSGIETKPIPEGSGAWSHPYHGPDNNPQADDQIARAPYRTRFLAAPWFGPMPAMTVASGGRLFKAFGHLAFKPREWPMLGQLVAMDAYNGTRLWQRDLSPGFMIHRNTLIATPSEVYVGDNEACHVIDAATGETLDRIVIPADLADGPAWKWMALRDGILYALIGEQEPVHPVQRGQRTQTGWPWTTVRDTYGPFQDRWGYGRTLLAWDLKARSVLWSRRVDQPIDNRSVCMNDQCIFAYSDQQWLSAVDIRDGSVRWRRNDTELLQALGPHHRAQDPRYGYATSSYAKCNREAVFFAGPQRPQLVAVSAADGAVLWTYADGNLQLVLREDGLYAMGRLSPSKKFDYRSGQVLAELDCFRGNCTRATGSADSIFARGYRHSGTLRLDVESRQAYRLAVMRPACQDGVIVAHGLCYWGPWMCDCNHSLIGVIALGPVGDSGVQAEASVQDRLEASPQVPSDASTLPLDERDWPTYRADNVRSSWSPVTTPSRVRRAWEKTPSWLAGGDCNKRPTGLPFRTSASIAVGEFVFYGGTDGVVRAVRASDGGECWKTYTGGAVHYPPSVADGRLYAGSADGWAYCLDGNTGQQVWRFRAAPEERRIPVYGRLASTWPVGSGVLATGDTVFLAAGMASHDGTHVYALEAESGSVRWENHQSGGLSDDNPAVGVSVQGHLLLQQDRLYLAGGNVVSPGIFDVGMGRCLNTLPGTSASTQDEHWQQQRAARGSELCLVGDQVVASGPMLYSPQADGPASRYHGESLQQASGPDCVVQARNHVVVCLLPDDVAKPAPAAIWKDDRFSRVDAMALSGNAVIVAGRKKGAPESGSAPPVLAALDSSDGHLLWEQPLESPVITGGIAIDRRGQILTTLQDGRLICWSSMPHD